MSNVRGLALALVGVFFALTLTVVIPSTEAQSARSYQRADPQGQYRPSANKRAKFQVGYLMHAHGEIR